MEIGRKRRIRRPIVLALVAIVLSVTLMVGGTFALFTDKVTVGRTHLQAGTLDVTLLRTEYSYSILDDQGYLKTYDQGDNYEPEDVEAEDIHNVFGLPEDALIVPQSELSVTFRIENNADVAFTYSVKLVVCDKDTGEELDEDDYAELHEQLSLTLTGLDGEHTLAEDSETLTINGTETVTVGSSATFTVTLTFIDDTAINNDAMSQSVSFDLVVSAIQQTTNPNTNG